MTSEKKSNGNKKLMEHVKDILKERGWKAFEIAKNTALGMKLQYKPLYDALQYFFNETWYDVQHPALVSLACEAVGGNPEKAVNIGAAIVLLAGAADIHDDIIDDSKLKNLRLTVYGKFNKDISLLLGDALLFEGLSFLHAACQKFSEREKNSILKLIKKAFFEIGNAEANEAEFKGKCNVNPKEYFSGIIKRKAAVAEAAAKIGAIIGGGTKKDIKILGRYGRALGILMTIRDEFVDMFELEELKNRIEKECLPLPMMYTFKDKNIKEKVLLCLQEESEKSLYDVIEKIMQIKEVTALKEKMRKIIERTIREIESIPNPKVLLELELLLKASIEDL
jgi:geranylgeranyl pyrophosphate synthase